MQNLPRHNLLSAKMHPPRFFCAPSLDARQGAPVSGLRNESCGIMMRRLWLTIFRGARRRGGAATTGGGDSRDWDDVWRRLGAAGSKGGGQRRRQQRGGFGLISLFSILRITLVFFSLIFFGTFQVKPQERKELCGGREGQTTYYVERKALPRKATLL